MAERERIAITGSSGIIGTVLREGLTDFDITPLDLPETDVRDYDQVLKKVAGNSAIIHLAWNTKDENFQTETYLEENTQMFMNVYRAAVEAKVPRVIMASSVEATPWKNYFLKRKIGVEDVPSPANLYGAHKVAMEAMGLVYAANKGLTVDIVRFGGVSPENIQNSPVWLDHGDCVSLMEKILQFPALSSGYDIVHAVSDNPDRVHSIDNPYGWEPQKRS